MNTLKPTIHSAPEVPRIPTPEPVLCTLPAFIKIPAVPGLPTELTGLALRDALRARAESVVSTRRTHNAG